jgi:hypothetical protein
MGTDAVYGLEHLAALHEVAETVHGCLLGRDAVSERQLLNENELARACPKRCPHDSDGPEPRQGTPSHCVWRAETCDGFRKKCTRRAWALHCPPAFSLRGLGELTALPSKHFMRHA